MRSSYIHLRGIPKVTGVSDVLNCLWFNALELLVFCKLGYILMILYLPLPHIFLVQPTMHFHISVVHPILISKKKPVGFEKPWKVWEKYSMPIPSAVGHLQSSISEMLFSVTLEEEMQDVSSALRVVPKGQSWFHLHDFLSHRLAGRVKECVHLQDKDITLHAPRAIFDRRWSWISSPDEWHNVTEFVIASFSYCRFLALSPWGRNSTSISTSMDGQNVDPYFSACCMPQNEGSSTLL